jgi:multidrug transporter EmrE-like cation transporter
MIIAIINAILREGIFTSFLNELRAHQLSTLTLMILFFIGTYLILHYSEIQLSDQQALIMGCIWVTMTILFEFVAGHYLFGNSWDKLIADYNIFKGRIWILIPITTLVSPYIANRLIPVFA